MKDDSKKLDAEFVKNAFVIAARDGQAEIVEELLNAGVDVHVWDDVALRLAAIKGDIETIQVLLNAGADVHARCDEAVRLANENGHNEAAKFLQGWNGKNNTPPTLEL